MKDDVSLFGVMKPYLKPGMVVLDVGAHDLQISKKFLQYGCTVIAIDKSSYTASKIPEGIEWIQKDFENYTPDKDIDVLFMSYVAPFIDRDVLFKKIVDHYTKCKIIAIRAFTQAPEPSFDRSISLYSTEDINHLPAGFDEYCARKWTDEHEDMRGNMRKWFEVDLLAFRKNS